MFHLISRQKLIFVSLSMICMDTFRFNLFIKINEKIILIKKIMAVIISKKLLLVEELHGPPLFVSPFLSSCNFKARYILSLCRGIGCNRSKCFLSHIFLNDTDNL